MYYIIRLLVCVCLCVVGILLVNRFSKNNLIAKRVILVVLSMGLFWELAFCLLKMCSFRFRQQNKFMSM